MEILNGGLEVLCAAQQGRTGIAALPSVSKQARLENKVPGFTSGRRVRPVYFLDCIVMFYLFHIVRSSRLGSIGNCDGWTPTAHSAHLRRPTVPCSLSSGFLLDPRRSLLDFWRVTSLTLSDSTRLWYAFAGFHPSLLPLSTPHIFFDLERRDPSISISRIPAGRLLRTCSNVLDVPSILRSCGREAGHRGLTYWQHPEHLFHPSAIQPAPHGSRQTRHGAFLASPSIMVCIEFDTDIFPISFGDGSIAATADDLLNSALSHHRAMRSKHVPDASKNRHHLD
ncbi:hypothetical protein B0H13DRAFT_2368421 [Mycena leptocephala]|nr:hypothetical protein B0H13DRAFT_2368421 [Mycena leptocephala]